MDGLSFCCRCLRSLSYIVHLISYNIDICMSGAFWTSLHLFDCHIYTEVPRISCMNIPRYRSMDPLMYWVFVSDTWSWNKQRLIQGQKQQVVVVVNQNYLMESWSGECDQSFDSHTHYKKQLPNPGFPFHHLVQVRIGSSCYTLFDLYNGVIVLSKNTFSVKKQIDILLLFDTFNQTTTGDENNQHWRWRRLK